MNLLDLHPGGAEFERYAASRAEIMLAGHLVRLPLSGCLYVLLAGDVSGR